jgi:hypothetical protein
METQELLGLLRHLQVWALRGFLAAADLSLSGQASTPFLSP